MFGMSDDNRRPQVCVYKDEFGQLWAHPITLNAIMQYGGEPFRTCFSSRSDSIQFWSLCQPSLSSWGNLP